MSEIAFFMIVSLRCPLPALKDSPSAPPPLPCPETLGLSRLRFGPRWYKGSMEDEGHRNIVVIGASAGGVEALISVVSALPADFPASVFVVLHISPLGTSVLPDILSRHGELQAAHGIDGELIEPKRIYVAPPDHHLFVDRDRIRVLRGPRENGYRPAIDPMFRSASYNHGARVIAVVLSGTLDDGTVGARVVHEAGGVTIAQDPDDAMYSGMPLSVIERDAPYLVLPAKQIGIELDRMVREPIKDQTSSAPDGWELTTAASQGLALQPEDHLDSRGERSALTCPECGGVLWEFREGDLVRFRCRVGHAYSVESMLAEQSKAVEAALWSSLRVLEERASLAKRLAVRLAESGRSPAAITHYEDEAAEAIAHAESLRRLLAKGITSDPEAIVKEQQQ
jgi:two-component system, chemotaxis family, protein-glutamate methylesterase/glutaminase